MPVGSIGFRGNRLSPGFDPLLEPGAAVRFSGMTSQPIAGSRELPRGFEIRRVGGEALAPEVCRSQCARKVLTFRVKRLGFRIACSHGALHGCDGRSTGSSSGAQNENEAREGGRAHMNILRPGEAACEDVPFRAWAWIAP